jgi:hypothetical protein
MENLVRSACQSKFKPQTKILKINPQQQECDCDSRTTSAVFITRQSYKHHSHLCHKLPSLRRLAAPCAASGGCFLEENCLSVYFFQNDHR